LSPKLAGVRLDIGLVEFRRRNYADAIAPLESVVRDEPGSGQARYLLGMCQVFTDRFEKATLTLEPLWAERSGDVMYLYVLGIAANKAGKKDLDERAMKRMLEVGEATPEFHLIIGKAYLQHQEYDAAFAELRKAEAANPELPFLHFNLGIAYVETGDSGKAEKEFLQDSRIDPELADNYYQLAKIYAQGQRDPEAVEAYREALKRDPRRPGAWFGLAKIYQKEGKLEEALRAVDETLKVVPESDKGHYLRGQLLSKLGKKEEAAVEFARAKKLMDADLDKDREKWNDKTISSPELTQGKN
jgi:tetratricopeptide (TPR) repeat protein